MKIKNYLTLIALLFSQLISASFAQMPPEILWDKTLGGSDDEGSSALGAFERLTVLPTSDGGFISAGSSKSGISGEKSQSSWGDYDYWVIKTNAAGVKEWDARYGGTGADYLTSMVATTDGGYLLGGTSFSGMNGDKSENLMGPSDFWIVKINSSGIIQWDAVYGGDADDGLLAMANTNDGGFILGGTTRSSISGDVTVAAIGGGDWWAVKIASDGTKEWDTRFGTNYFNGLYDLEQTSDGGYILGGEVRGSGGSATPSFHDPSPSNADYWIIRTDATGAKLWDKRFGGSGIEGDVLVSVEETNDGGFLLGGYSASGVSGDRTEFQRSSSATDSWVIKTDANGNYVWDHAYGGGVGSSGMNNLHQTSDGGFILLSGSNAAATFEKSENIVGVVDYWILKADSNGTKQWDKTLGGDLRDIAYDFAETSLGGLIIGGYSMSNIYGDKTEANRGSTGTQDFWIILLCDAPQTFYADADGDGYGNPALTIEACSQPSDYSSNNSDCNDGDAAIHPGATETCNGVDDNCEGQVDEGVQSAFYRDQDVDGYGNASVTIQACAVPPGYVANNIDCNDGDAAIHPGATETCDGMDDNCNEQIDEGITCDDVDGDSYTTAQGDCDDYNASVYPGAEEICNNIDDNCNGQIDEGVLSTFAEIPEDICIDVSAIQLLPASPGGIFIGTAVFPFGNDWYFDPSLAGVGGPYTITYNNGNCGSSSQEIIVHELPTVTLASLDDVCITEAPFTLTGGSPSGLPTDLYLVDFNITDIFDAAALGLGSHEVIYFYADQFGCSAFDTKPVEVIAASYSYYVDADGDGYGSSTTALLCAATPPAGYSSNSSDCNDANASIHPNATEICGNGIDDDCNFIIDENCCSISVSAGSDENLYFGYSADQCESKTVSITGGASPFAYQWTLDRALLYNVVNASGDESMTGSTTATVTFCLLDTAALCVTVTDADGCTASDCANIYAEDVRCFSGNSGTQKVTVCHKTGNPSNPCVKICVDQSAVAAHLAHGDFVGKCNATCTARSDEFESFDQNGSSLHLYPNPSDGAFTLMFTSTSYTDEDVQIQIVNTLGQSVYEKEAVLMNGELQNEIQLRNQTSGMYLVRLITGKEQFSKQIIIEK